MPTDGMFGLQSRQTEIKKWKNIFKKLQNKTKQRFFALVLPNSSQTYSSSDETGSFPMLQQGVYKKQILKGAGNSFRRML